MEHEHGESECPTHRQEVQDDGFDGNEQRAEGDEQHDRGNPEDQGDGFRESPHELLLRIDVGGGEARDQDLRPGQAPDVTGHQGAHPSHHVHQAREGDRVRGDHVEQRDAIVGAEIRVEELRILGAYRGWVAVIDDEL